MSLKTFNSTTNVNNTARIINEITIEHPHSQKYGLTAVLTFHLCT